MGFALTYFEARGRFLAAAAGSGATVEVHELSGETDPDGRALTLDVARSGPSEADVVLVCLSGTHGAEFFAGSAAQVAWLERARQAELPAGFAMVLIHAVNPFGFAHLTRTNERGVDLNRNAMDFGAPLPANDIYGDLHPVVDAAVADYLRSGRLSSARVEVIERCRDALIAVHGRWAVADSIERGQYRWPDGLEYGGDRLQWSLGVVFDIVRRHVAQARHVAYIDGHTLLRVGDGNVVYLCFNREDNSLRSRCASWWGADRIDRHTIGRQWEQGTSAQIGRTSRHGLVFWGVQHAAAPDADVAGAVIELGADPEPTGEDRPLASAVDAAPAHGTADPLLIDEVLSLARARWLVEHRNDHSARAERRRAEARHEFSPTRSGWERASIVTSLEIMDATVRGAADWVLADVPASPGVLVRSDAGEAQSQRRP